jgi:hypothetical protein
MRFAILEKVTNKKKALEIEERRNLCAFFAIRFVSSPEGLPINKSRAENFDDAFSPNLVPAPLAHSSWSRFSATA